MNRILFSLAVAACAAATATAADPRLSAVTPRGGQRGTELKVSFVGQNLQDAEEIFAHSPGFSFKDLSARDDRRVDVTMVISPECKLGEHVFRVRTRTGVSEMRTFWVGPFPSVREKEPNNDFEAPQPIELNVTVEGVVDAEDVDYYQVTAKKGQRISVEIEGMRLGRTFFDPYVAILDSKRFELATNDDAPMLGQDPAVSIIAPEDGEYVIQVRESSYGGSGASQYRMHVGTFPRPTALVPAGGKAGTEVEVRFIGDPSGDIVRKVKLPEKADPAYAIEVEDGGVFCPSPVPFRVSDFDNVVEVEPNSSHDTATPAVIPGAFNGVIQEPGDVDYYRFTAKKGQQFKVRCYARVLGSPLDSVMAISKFKGGGVVNNDDAGGPDSAFDFNVPDDGEYVLQVYDHLRSGGPDYFYRVEFEPVAPSLALSMPKYGRDTSQERQTITVPRGNRYAVLLTATRQNFGGDLVVTPQGLPEGLTFQTENMPANMTTVPVLFEAAPDAPVGGNLITIDGKPADANVRVSGTYSQTASLIVGNPGQSVYWQSSVDKAAVAVGDPAPFRVSIAEPKVPLVQNGTMNLKVVAERDGFDGPITVRMLYNPPGVNSVTTATIPQGKNEAELRINAAGNAQPKTWKIAVLGDANPGKGQVWVSSQLADLTVAAPYVAFTIERAAVEQGQEARLLCKVQTNTPFEGKAIAKLVGLPAKVTTTDLELTKDTTELLFPITAEADSPVGRHKGLICQVIVPQNGEQVFHTVGQAELRIDAPPPPKADAPPKPAVVAKEEPPKQPAEKPLSRLEKLRLEQEAREKAMNE